MVRSHCWTFSLRMCSSTTASRRARRSASIARSYQEYTAAMIVIHHIEGRRSERVVWLLEELGGIPYKLEFKAGDVMGSLLQLERVHEMRMAPIVQDGERTIVESGAILEWLLAKYGAGSPLRPREGTPELARYLEFMHFAEGTA